MTTCSSRQCSRASLRSGAAAPVPDSCCVGHQRHLLIEIRRADRNLAKSAPFKGIFPTTGPQILCPRTECVALFYLLEPTLMLYGVPRVSQCSPHPSFAYFRRWLRRSLPLPCCGPCDSLLYAIDIGSTGSESRGLRNGPSRSSSVRVHDPTNERTVRIVSVLPVARVVSALLQRCCSAVATALHTLQDQRMSLAKIWNA